MTQADPSTIVDQIFADLPQVHNELGNPEGGVWRTERDCYELIASLCNTQSRTLETGLGLSTMLFLHLQTWHTCVAPWTTEVERLRGHCQERGIAMDRLTLIQGFSDEILPGLPQTELDLVLLDGGHGFPTPILDWYYGARYLCRGGALVIDDVHLPAVRLLTDYLDADPRWTSLAVTPKWVAYKRLSEGSLRDEHTEQSFWGI